MNKIHNFLSTAFIAVSSLTYSGQETIIAIPGILGDNDTNGYSNIILNYFKDKNVHKMGTIPVIERLRSPWKQADFGQDLCVNYFTTKIKKKSVVTKNAIVIATSQGTATSTRFLVDCPQSDMPKMFICEGYAASFNACFEHSAECLLPIIKYLPLKYYWLPYVMKLISWQYNPAKQQAFELLEKLPKDFIIILVHCKQDRLTPYEGSLAAYQQLRTTGHDKTYLVSVDMNLGQNPAAINNHDIGHIDVLENTDILKCFQCLLHTLLNDENIDFAQFQPDVTDQNNCQILEKYKNRQQWTRYLWYVSKINLLLLSSYIAYKIMIR